MPITDVVEAVWDVNKRDFLCVIPQGNSDDNDQASDADPDCYAESDLHPMESLREREHI